jgi:signal transduction histidine kinase
MIKTGRGGFGLRLNLWYAAIFIVTASGLFGLAYFILATTLQQKERELIGARLDEYRAWYEAGGLPWLTRKFYNTPNSGKNAFFVRIISRGGDALFVSIPESWEGFDPKQIEPVSVDEPRPWFSLAGKQGRQVWLIASAPLSTSRVLQVGKSTEQTAALLNHFRLVFSLVLIGVVILGFAAGAFFTRRALQPIRQLGQTVHGIIETGRMNARLPARGNRDEIDTLVTLFNQMLEKNETLIRGMRDALDNVAHDLRTPMARLRGLAEQALQSGDPAACREALADAVEESEKLMTMLQTLMDISEAETGAMKLTITTVNLAALVHDVRELYQILAEEKQITLTASVPDKLEIQADRNRLQQCLANLVDNAIKYTPNGGTVAITAAQDARQTTLTVKDNGAGISADDLPRIWDRLYRGDKSRHEKGLGLGLSLVKAFVEAHHGQVQVASAPGQGAVFTISLPQAAGD